MQPGEIRDHLIDRLAAIFGKPKNAEALAAELARHVPPAATAGDVTGLADRLIATRKTKGFPPASELIAAVRLIAPQARSDAATAPDDGTIRFDGEAPVTWVPADDPRWSELVGMAKAEAKAAGRKCRITPTTSKNAPGYGWFFQSAHVDALPLTATERERLKSSRSTERYVENIAKGLRMFARGIRTAIAPALPPAVPVGEGPHALALREAQRGTADGAADR